MAIVVKVEKNGRILLPVSIRRAVGIRDGHSELIVDVDPSRGSLTLETRDQALERIRARLAGFLPNGTMLSEELLADRREESKRG